MLIGRAPGIAARLRFAKTLVLSALLVFGLPVQAADAPTADDVRAALDSGSALRVDGQPLRAEVLREFYASIELRARLGTRSGRRRALGAGARRAPRSAGPRPRAGALRARRAAGAARSRRRRRWPSSASSCLTDSPLSLRGGRAGRPATPRRGPAGLGTSRRPTARTPSASSWRRSRPARSASWLEALPPPHEGYARLVAALRALHAAADRAGSDRPADPRVRQVAVNLERWRWLPRRLESPHLVVNAADATIAVVEDGRVRLASRVVVGDELHPTPVVRSELGAIVFNPPWTVPTSIVVDEFLPKLRANPRFLADNDIVILDRREDPYGLAIDWTAVPTDAIPVPAPAAPRRLEPAGPDALRHTEPLRRLPPRHAPAGALPARRPGAEPRLRARGAGA